jgi:hypothetical protein
MNGSPWFEYDGKPSLSEAKKHSHLDGDFMTP